MTPRLGSGRLPFEQLAQLSEQSRILDGDHGLSGKILHQLDLLVSERPNLLPIDADGADQHIVLQHWHVDGGSRAAELDRHAEGGFSSIVGGVAHLLCPHYPVEQASWHWLKRSTPLSEKLGKC